jgi:hypothetical protein
MAAPLTACIDIRSCVFSARGKEYLGLFCSVTGGLLGKKVVFYNSSKTPAANGCLLRRFETATRTNWHYECANAFLQGAIHL